MKRILIALIAILSISAYINAQSESNYSIMPINEEQPVTTLSEAKLKKCEALIKDAQWYIKKKEFGKAKNKLNQLLAINPQDSQAKVLLQQCEENTAIYGESAEKAPNKFSFGVTAGMDFFKVNYGIHFGFTLRYGHFTDLVNVTAGAEFEVHQAYKGQEDDIFEGYDEKITLGGQIIIPLLAKFNIAKITDKTRFYAGAGGEFGLKLYAKDINTGWIYHNQASIPMMNSSTVSGLVQVGVTARHFDVGIYYKHFFNDLVNEEFPKYQENDRIGFSATYYF